MSKLRRIRITCVHKDDGFYGMRDEVIGREGTFELNRSGSRPGYFSGRFWFDDHEDDLDYWYFLAIRYKKV